MYANVGGHVHPGPGTLVSQMPPQSPSNAQRLPVHADTLDTAVPVTRTHSHTSSAETQSQPATQTLCPNLPNDASISALPQPFTWTTLCMNFNLLWHK